MSSITNSAKSSSSTAAEWLVNGLDARGLITLLAAWAGMAMVVLVSLPLALFLNVWLDESFTWHTTGSGPLYAYLQSVNFELQPPLYFVLESIWRMVNESSIIYARVPSIIFAALAVGVMVVMASKLAPRIHPMVVAAVTALNPIVIWAAVEMRVYALVFLVGAVLIWTFFEGFCNTERTDRSARVAYVIFAIIGLYTQYYVGFILLAHFITLVFMRRKAIVPFLLSMIPVSIAFAPFLTVVKTQMEQDGSMVAHTSLLSVIHQVTNFIFIFVLPHDVNWVGVIKIAGFIIASLLTLTVFLIGRPKLTSVQAAVVIPWLISVVVFIALLSVTGVPLSLERHIIVLAPPSMLVALLLLSSLTGARTAMYACAALVFVMFSIGEFRHQYHPPLAKFGDWQRVATAVTQDGPIPVATFTADLALPLSVYYKGDLIPVPEPMHFDYDYFNEDNLRDEAQVIHSLNPNYLHGKSNRLWVITKAVCHGPAINNCQMLEDYLNQRYHLVRTVTFYGTWARLFEKNHA